MIDGLRVILGPVSGEHGLIMGLDRDALGDRGEYLCSVALTRLHEYPLDDANVRAKLFAEVQDFWLAVRSHNLWASSQFIEPSGGK